MKSSMELLPAICVLLLLAACPPFDSDICRPDTGCSEGYECDEVSLRCLRTCDLHEDAACPCDDEQDCEEVEVCHEGSCCAPACGERECGEDGCGGSCGDCQNEWACADGVCIGGCAARAVAWGPDGMCRADLAEGGFEDLEGAVNEAAGFGGSARFVCEMSGDWALDEGACEALDFEWALWPIQNALFEESYLLDEASGTVTDETTGLVWQKGFWGPFGGASSWQDAVEGCAELGQGFRLPTIIELRSIIARDREPSIVSPPFDMPHGGAWFWSSSEQAYDPSAAYIASFVTGWVYPSPKSSGDVSVHARCVRSEEVRAVVEERYVIDIDAATVSDRETGLLWSRTHDDATTHDAALTACLDRSDEAGVDFVLPTVKELESLVDVRNPEVAIDEDAFESPATEYFWSATEAGSGPMWVVGFWDGDTDTSQRQTELTRRVRCVHRPTAPDGD